MKKSISVNKIIFIIFLLFAQSCIKRIDDHGYNLEFSDYEFLEEGVSTKNRALQIMGSPSFTSNLAENEIWFYYSQNVEKFLFFKPKIVKREILSLEFDRLETLIKIKKYNLEDEKNISFSRDYTKVKSNKIGFFKALFGNVGRVTPQ